MLNIGLTKEEIQLRNYALGYLKLLRINPELARRFYVRYESIIKRAYRLFNDGRAL